MATSKQLVKEAFDLFDKNGDGTISATELREAMLQAGHKESVEDVKKLLKAHDKDENGVLSLEEFEEFLKKDNSANHAELKEAFDMFDKNKNGYITRDELTEAMKNVGESLADDDIETMIRKADINRDNQVSFEEFKRMMTLKN